MSLDIEPHQASGDADAFEHFLTAAILTRCLNNDSRQLSAPDNIEELIARLASALRSAARSAMGTRKDRPNALPRHKVRAVAAHVLTNLDRPIRVAELAAIVHISPCHFSRQFHAATGLAPHQYVRHCRIRRAARLLIDTEMSVCSVAIEVGCVDQSHLANAFRRTFGCTPRDFQRSVRRSASTSPAVSFTGAGDTADDPDLFPPDRLSLNPDRVKTEATGVDSH